MRKITCKYACKCRETGRPIAKGQEMLYFAGTKSCYHLESDTAKAFLSGATETADQQEARNTRDYIQASEDAYFDNILHSMEGY